MAKKRTKRQQAIIKRRIFLTCSAAVLIAVIALVAFSVNALLKIGKRAAIRALKQTAAIPPPFRARPYPKPPPRS